MKTQIIIVALIALAVVGLSNLPNPALHTGTIKFDNVRTDASIKYPYNEELVGCYFVEQVLPKT